MHCQMLQNREMKSESGFSLAMASQPLYLLDESESLGQGGVIPDGGVGTYNGRYF